MVNAWEEVSGGAPGMATHELLRGLVKRIEPRLGFGVRFGTGAASREDVAAWQAEVVDEVGVRVTETVVCEGYTRQRVEYEGAFGGTVPAYVLVPGGVGSSG